uniref:Uncharacterized protein n=1 Tax=Oryza glumipatula TaxID=40148 RepID=A0A0D9YWD7_9ORYZ
MNMRQASLRQPVASKGRFAFGQRRDNRVRRWWETATGRMNRKQAPVNPAAKED